MIYYHNKLQKEENISLEDFIKVVEFLDNEGFVSQTMYNYHAVFEYYKDQLTFSDSYDAKHNTMTKFNIGKVTFYNIIKRFKNN